MVISPSQTVIARYFFNGDHPILGFLYVYPSGVMRFQTTKKTTIVILSYIVFNVKVVGSNSVSMFKTSCADPRFWGGSCIESRRFWPWPGGENEDFYGGLDTSIVFQNIVIDLQRGDEIYGCLRWIVAWAPSFTTGWSAIPLVEKWADQKRLKQPSLLGVHGPHPDVWFSIATFVDPGPFEGILGLGRPSFKAAGDPAVKASQPPDIADKCWLYPIYSAHCMEGFLNGTLPHHPSHDQFRNFQQPWWRLRIHVGEPPYGSGSNREYAICSFWRGISWCILYAETAWNSFGGINLPFPVMGGLWHCFTHINQNTTKFDQPRSIRRSLARFEPWDWFLNVKMTAWTIFLPEKLRTLNWLIQKCIPVDHKKMHSNGEDYCLNKSTFFLWAWKLPIPILQDTLPRW